MRFAPAAVPPCNVIGEGHAASNDGFALAQELRLTLLRASLGDRTCPPRLRTLIPAQPSHAPVRPLFIGDAGSELNLVAGAIPPPSAAEHCWADEDWLTANQCGAHERPGRRPGCWRRGNRVFGWHPTKRSAQWQKITGQVSRTTNNTKGCGKKGMSKSRAAAISNSPGASSRGGKSSGSAQSRRSSGSGSGGNQSQKKAAGRKGGKKSS